MGLQCVVGYPNGEIPLTALVEVVPGQFMEREAAAQLVAWRNEVLELTGFDLFDNVNELYRNLAGQIYWKDWWTREGKPQNAATPRWSIHGCGWAGDFAIGRSMGSLYWTIRALATKWGFFFDVDGEDWHASYHGNPDQWAPLITTPIIIIPKQEEDTMRVFANETTNVWAIGRAGAKEPFAGIPAGKGGAYLKATGQDGPEVLKNDGEWDAVRELFAGSRDLTIGVYADVDTNAWLVMGPGVKSFPIPGGQGDLWQQLFGPVQRFDHGTIETLRQSFENMQPSTIDIPGIAKAIADRIAGR